jgi:hypothetical protein
MFHVIDPETGCHVFTETDPREDDFVGPVDCDVILDDLDSSVIGEGQEFPTSSYLGRSNEDHRRFRVFGSHEDCTKAGFHPLCRWEEQSYERWSDYKSRSSRIR